MLGNVFVLPLLLSSVLLTASSCLYLHAGVGAQLTAQEGISVCWPGRKLFTWIISVKERVLVFFTHCWHPKGSLHQHLLYGNQRPHRWAVRHKLHGHLICMALNGFFNSFFQGGLYSCFLPRGQHCLDFFSPSPSTAVCVFYPSAYGYNTQVFLPPCLASRPPVNNLELVWN